MIAAVTRRSPLMTELCPMLESDINATTRRRLPIAIADSLVEGIPVSPDIPEEKSPQESPQQYVQRLSKEKALKAQTLLPLDFMKDFRHFNLAYLSKFSDDMYSLRR